MAPSGSSEAATSVGETRLAASPLPLLRARRRRRRSASPPPSALEGEGLEPDAGVARRSGSAGPAARRCRRRRAPPCRARPAAGSRRGTPCALLRRCVDFALRAGPASLRAWSTCVVELARFLALRAEQQHPEGDGERRRRRASRRSAGSRSSARASSQPSPSELSEPSEASSEAARGFRRRSSRAPLLRLRPTGTGAASKATTSSNLAMNSRVRQSPPPPEPPPAARRAAFVLASSEDWTPTRVTPSMSLSAVTKPATASWPAAQPLSSSAGPGDRRRAARRAAASAAVDVASGEADAVEADQPDVAGQDQREFAHHPLPVEAAVGEAADRRDPLFAAASGTGCRRRGARRGPLRPRLRASAWRLRPCRSEIWLPVRTSSGDADQDERPARRGRCRAAARCAAAPGSPRRSSGGIRLTGRIAQLSRARP